MRQRELTDLAATVVELIGNAEPSADVEVTIDRTEQALTRFAKSAIHQNVADESAGIRLRLHLDGRTITLSSSTASTGDELAGFVDRALHTVRSGPADPGWPGVAPASALPPPGDAPLVGAAAERAAVVRTFVDAAGGLETAGYCRTTRSERGFANSAGHAAVAAFGSSAFDGIARRDESDGVARVETDTIGEIDGHALGVRATAKAIASANAVELPAGRYPVLLEPTAVADLVSMLVVYGFNGKAVTQRQSFAEVGTAQFDASITLVDDAPSLGITFDADGTPTSRHVLVDAGTTAAVTHDRRTAAESSTFSTGHSFGGGSSGGVALHAGISPVTSAGPVPDDIPELVDPAAGSLLASIDRAILVSDLWYTRVLDPKSLVVTGLTRNGVWIIEDGEITTPVKNFRFTQAYPAALAPGAVHQVGPIAVGSPEGWIPARWTVPALHLASWNFTGGASG